MTNLISMVVLVCTNVNSFWYCETETSKMRIDPKQIVIMEPIKFYKVESTETREIIHLIYGINGDLSVSERKSIHTGCRIILKNGKKVFSPTCSTL